MSETVYPAQQTDGTIEPDTNSGLSGAISALRPINRLPKHAVDNIVKHASIYHASVGETLQLRVCDENLVYFLLEGSIQVFKQDGSSDTLIKSDPRAKTALGRIAKASTDIVACSPTSLIRIPWDLLERYLIQYAPAELSSTLEVQEILSSTSSDWMVRLLQSELFSILPPTNIQEILSSLEFVDTFGDEVIVEEGSSGDHFYIVDQGEFLVSRLNSKTGAEVELAVLKADDFFGEEALITGAPRSATVTSIGKGKLIRLDSRKFKEYIVAPVVPLLSADGAKSLVTMGAQMIDIREPDKFAVGAIPQSANIMLNLLRAEQAALDKQNTYVVVDDTPDAAATAVFILRAKGYDARCLNLPLQKYAVLQGIELDQVNQLASQEAITLDASQLELAETNEETLEEYADIADLDFDSTVDGSSEKTSHTLTGIGLTELIEELNEAYEDTPDSDSIAPFQLSDVEDVANGVNTDRETRPTIVDSGYEISYIDDDDAPNDSATNSAASNSYSEETRRALEAQRDRMNAEFAIKLNATKQAANKALEAERIQLHGRYSAKRKLLLESGKKLVALANKVRQQQADIQGYKSSSETQPMVTKLGGLPTGEIFGEQNDQNPSVEQWSAFLRTAKL